MNKTDQPLVSCVMPTYNRRKFIPNAIRYFLRQEYEKKELIIIDDGTDAIRDLIPDTPSIKYYRLDRKITLGAKLNLACKYTTGNIIANWDDDDWYAPRRLAYQVNALLTEGKELCGINQLLYYDLRSGDAYQYVYPANQRVWLLGSSLCYTKELWNKHQFADINVGMDGLFVWAASPDRVKVLADSSIAVHMIHDHNVSPKLTNGQWWHSYPPEEIQKIINGDWIYYTNQDCRAPHIKVNGHTIKENSTRTYTKTIKNVYACLVHEDEDCIIDLVRNLHYHDPASVILLYNGGENANLLKSQFPYKQYGAVIHSNPRPVKHGYLHQFALDCMQFALENFSFDSFTCVDSDQLLIRSGYSEYLEKFLFSSPGNIGMLSSMPKRITTTDADNSAFWPAIQALKEFDLWKPLLKLFPDGESKFVHWTFWPSSVFTKDAIRDIVKLFKENKQLQEIMTKTKIWATEEVILPTLVKLLGYEIVLNPCSYDFVKYRKLYTLEDINNASNKADVYWIHPIERKYSNSLRISIRQKFNHYLNNNKVKSFNNSSTNMVLLSSLLNQITQIEGWLDNQEADLLISTTLKACIDLPSPHSIVEIGSYHGKSTVLLGSIAKTFFPAAKVYAIDPHNGVIGATDQGLHSLSPTLQMFKNNITNAGLTDVIETIVNYSYKVDWQAPIALLFIDGLHDYPNVARDFWHFSDWVSSGGYIAFHDYAEYYPGVQAFVNELLATDKYLKVQQAKSLIVLQKL